MEEPVRNPADDPAVIIAAERIGHLSPDIDDARDGPGRVTPSPEVTLIIVTMRRRYQIKFPLIVHVAGLQQYRTLPNYCA